MPIHESVPERRNLLLLSIGIIVFYLAGGQLTDEVIRIHIINVRFSNPNVLIYLVWGLLFWFCYRYWLVLQDSWREAYLNELTSDDCRFIYYDYLLKKFHLNEDCRYPFFANRHLVKIERTGRKLSFECVLYKNEQRHIAANQERQSLPVSTFTDWLYITFCSVYLFFRRPTLSTYFTPYILFLLAVFLGLYHRL